MSTNTESRLVANLVPYKWAGKSIHMFLQRRCGKAEIRPNLLGLWGGGIGKQTPMGGLLNELVQELQYRPDTSQLEFIGEFDDEEDSHKHVYMQEVDEDFENQIKICEGTGGEWISYEQIKGEEDISSMEKEILYAVNIAARNKVAIH